jgi:hypothetical protein
MANGMADIGARVKSIVQTWAHIPTEPAGDAILENLWVNSGTSADFSLGAEDLAQQLNSELGSNVLGSDITSTMTVDQLIDML